MKQRKTRRTTVADIESGLRVELRAVFRQYDDLRKPLDQFKRHPHRSDGEPQFFVVFDRSELREITGLKSGVKKLVLPDERILECVFRFSESVWHLKDRLKQLAKSRGLKLDVEDVAERHQDLRVCCDLANAKKHGRCENRSGLNPHLGVLSQHPDAGGVGLVQFDTKDSGVVELFYNGSTKKKILLVTNPAPIPFRVDVLVGDGTSSIGDAVSLILSAFYRWRPVIQELGILDTDDPERKVLRSYLDADAD